MSKNKDIDPYEEEWKKNFTAKLNKLVNENENSINKIATETSMDTKSLRNYLSGASIPSAFAMTKLAKYFGVSSDYLATAQDTDSDYFGNTIIELGKFIKNFDIEMVKCGDDYENITLKIENKLLTVMIRELLTCRNFENYDDIVEKLVQSYGNMRIHKNQLVDYATFQNLIRHEYIYNGIEDDIKLCYCVDTGEDCYSIDAITFEEIERRRRKWDKMTTRQREEWWKGFQELKRDVARFKAEQGIGNEDENEEDDDYCFEWILDDEDDK